MGLRSFEIFLLLQCGVRLQTSEADVYGRQILMTKFDPRAVRVKISIFPYHIVRIKIKARYI